MKAQEFHKLVLGKFDILQADVSDLKTEVSDLATDVGTLKNNVDGLAAEVGTLKTNVSQLQTSVARIEDNLWRFQEESSKSHDLTQAYLNQAFSHLSSLMSLDIRVREVEKRTANRGLSKV